MTDMPETIAAWRFHPEEASEWLHGGWSLDHNHQTTEYRRADLRPTREQIEAMVNPLEWESLGDGYAAKCRAFYRASYFIRPPWKKGATFELCLSYPSYQHLFEGECRYPSMEEAKAAAQADHTRRILAALGYEVE